MTMLHLNRLSGFGAGGDSGPPDSIPDSISGVFADISVLQDSPTDATGSTGNATISGINQTITVRLTVTTSFTASYKGQVFVAGVQQGSDQTSGTTLDCTITNGQTLSYTLINTQNGANTWSGTGTVSNESDGGTTLDTFTYTLQINNVVTMSL